MLPRGCKERIIMPAEKSLQEIEGAGTKKCPECGSKDIVRKDDELYCQKCGFVIE